MAKHNSTFLRDWKKCAAEWEQKQSSYLFPGDEKLADTEGRLSSHKSFKSFVDSPDFGQGADSLFHLQVLPNPFWGDIERASVFLLMLNPGFRPLTWFLEEKVADVRKMRLQNLRQDFEDQEFPFFPLAPKFSYDPSADYWRQKFGGLLTAIENEGKTHLEALALLSQNVACLQLMPYHSHSFRKLPRSVRNLASTQASVDYVKQVILPKAEKNKATVIALRGGTKWDIPPKVKNVITYQGSAAHGAHLSATSEAGKAILQRILK